MTEVAVRCLLSILYWQKTRLIDSSLSSQQEMSQFGDMRAFISVLMPMSGSVSVENKIQN